MPDQGCRLVESEFAAGIEALLRNKQMARSLGLNGRARVNREYKDVHQVASLEKLFLQIYGRPAGTRSISENNFNIDGSRTAAESVLLQPIQAAETALHV